MSVARFRQRGFKQFPQNTQVGVWKEAQGSNPSTQPIWSGPWYDWPWYEDKCWDQTNPKPYRGGGPLRIEHAGQINSMSSINTTYKEWGMMYNVNSQLCGRCFYPVYGVEQAEEVGSYSPLPSTGSLSSADAEALGPEAWNLFRPGKPIMGLSVSLAELRELPKSVRDVRRAIEVIRKIPRTLARKNYRRLVDETANQYLGYQFGWKQICQDVWQIAHAQSNTAAYYRQLERNNGVWHKRSGTMSSGETIGHSRIAYDYILQTPLCPGMFGWPQRISYSSGSVERVWFVGRFRYFVPPVKTPNDEIKRVLRAYGLTLPTPDVLWNLMPWTWLVDYFTSIGDSIANLSGGAVDDLVAESAFIMKSVRFFERSSGTVYFKQWNGSDNVPFPVSLSGERFSELKSRLPASPFGFGLTSQDLTGRQTSILAALGIKYG